MDQQLLIITGASDGIGAAAARALAKAGNHVVIIGRSPDKTKAVATELQAPYYLADFAALDSVRSLADQLLKDFPRIDVLVNNAGGIMGTRREVTEDGHEKTFQVNHLAPFLLTTQLMDRLVASKASIITTSSVANRTFSSFNIDDLEATEKYTPFRAYGNSKLANILFSRELDRRYHAKGIAAASFHPGVVATNFSHGSGGAMRFLYQTPLRHLLTTSQQGADTLIWLATTAPGNDWKYGAYYEKRKIAKAHPLAYDNNLASELWDRSLAMLA